MSETFQLVKRPDTYSGQISRELLDAILKTVETDQAVHITKIEGQFLSWQAKVRMVCRKYNLKLRFRRVKRTGAIYIWAEKLEAAELDAIIDDELEDPDEQPEIISENSSEHSGDNGLSSIP